MEMKTHRGLTPIAIVGCGAVAERLHLPGLATSSVVRVTTLVDLSEERLHSLGRKFGISQLHSQLDAVGEHADVAIVAVPHHLHAQVAIRLLESGVHVFVEKPLATNMAEARAMIAAGVASGRKIGVGLVRRQYPAFKEVAAILQSGLLGTIRSFDFREGGKFGWPAATVATFRRATAGGVLLDTGAHTLDTVLAWLGEPEDVTCLDDSEGGVDANCLLELKLASGVKGIVELSRTRALRNTCIIRGDTGELEVGIAPDSRVTVRAKGLRLASMPADRGQRSSELPALAREQVESFVSAIETSSDWPLFAERTLASIRVFDEARQRRGHLDLPWTNFSGLPDLRPLTGRTILVLGGTGFIGGRLVEALARHSGARVRVLARSIASLANVSRFDVDFAYGDVTDATALARAMEGCEVVVNCTYGDGTLSQAREINVEAVRSILTEASRAHVQRVIHISTVSAYGDPPDGDLRETSVHRARRSDPYGRSKWEGEVQGQELAGRLGLDFLILQPTVVYGPAAPSWTVHPLSMLRRELVTLVDGGSGLCNAVYVDDVVQAILRAAAAPAGKSQRFLVSGPGPVTWQEFYGAYETMLGRTATVSLSEQEIRKMQREARRASGLLSELVATVREPAVQAHLQKMKPAQIAHALLPRRSVQGIKEWVGRDRQASTGGPAREVVDRPRIHVPSPAEVRLQRSRVRVVTAKAEQVLGYVPSISLHEGMARTEQWARWARLLD
jgi:predicted dehydrogenase